MTQTKIALSSLALDLKRVALGYWRGSNQTGSRFCVEALKRKTELDQSEVKPYIKEYLNKLPRILGQSDKKEVAEDALMYSTIFQNYALKID